MAYVKADTINGIEYFDVLGDEIQLLSAQDFYESLPKLKDGEKIYADLDGETLRKIESEYGIN